MIHASLFYSTKKILSFLLYSIVPGVAVNQGRTKPLSDEQFEDVCRTWDADLSPEDNLFVEYKFIRLDGQRIDASKHVSTTKNRDNTCVMWAYSDERNEEKVAYCRVYQIFGHTSKQGGQERLRYFFQGKWFKEVQGTHARNPVTNIRRIRRNESWDSDMADANNIFPVSCVFWPSDPLKNILMRNVRKFYDVIVERNPTYEHLRNF